ncbi:hypothetical protein LXA00_18000, partial [Erwinia amylovora]|uniref:hypothetical protein n=1 Tax=Erwinia amylovora TaxID=552 RepID=UPI0020C0DE71
WVLFLFFVVYNLSSSLVLFWLGVCVGLLLCLGVWGCCANLLVFCNFFSIMSAHAFISFIILFLIFMVSWLNFVLEPVLTGIKQY